ncbi:MAG TPA: hypothetical protein VD862_01800 [Candidatus Paceibacterota bacterium]|nr:hypothetical protein [Candidatus Paceibacterota bacterium]
MSKRIIRSEAMDSYRAKYRDARRRLRRDFVAFVQTPHLKDNIGYVVYGTNGEAQSFQTPTFATFLVGNPPVQVQEVKEALIGFYEYILQDLDARDAYAPVVLAMLKGYMQMYLEEKDEPLALATEVLCCGSPQHVFWCDFDGGEGMLDVFPKRKRLIIRGCFDKEVRGEVSRILRRRLQQVRPNKRTLKLMERELKKATGLKFVSYNVMSL